MRAPFASTRAELLRLSRWPALWVLVGTWTLLNLAFVYGFNYVTYRTGDTSFATQGLSSDALLAAVLPAAVPQSLVQGMPAFGGAILMILGALTVGSGFGWGTWKTVLTQGPGRLAAFGGTLATLALAVVSVVVLTAGLDLAMSSILAAVESQPVVLPSLPDLIEAVGSGVLILGMWTAAGVLVGVVTKSPAIAVGLGLVWSLVVENLLRAFGEVLGGLGVITDYLPGTAAGSLAGALSASGGQAIDSTPGVLTVLDGPTATWLLVGYIVAFCLLAAALMRRRDLA